MKCDEAMNVETQNFASLRSSPEGNRTPIKSLGNFRSIH